MKKYLLLITIGMMCCAGAMAQTWTPVPTTQMNPFAYYLDAELSKDYSTITVKYCLNADAKSVTIVFLDGETIVKQVEVGIDKHTKTAAYTQRHSVVVSTEGLPTNKKITWRIEVKGAGRANCGVYSSDGTNAYRYKFYRPSSVDIIQDPSSTDYGKVLVVESQHEASTTSGLHSSLRKKKNGNDDPQGAGIYVFNPDLTPRENTSGTYVFNGTNDDRFKGTEFAPYRVRVSEDGRMFVSSLHPNGDILWEINKDFRSWSTVIGKEVSGTTWVGNKNTSAKVDTDYRLNTTNGDFIAAPCAGLDVRGKGEDLKLLLLSCTEQAFGNGQPGFHTCEYNLGTAKTWNQVPSKDFETNFLHTDIDQTTQKPKSVFAATTTSNVQYDKDGGIWCVSFRGTCKDSEPGLVHKTAAGKEDCRMLRSNTKNAALRFNKTFTRAMMASEGNYGVLYDYIPDHGSNDDKQGYFFIQRNIDMSAVGSYLNDFAWDNANNIYTVGASSQNGGNGHLVVYCLPYNAEDVFTTPGPSTFTLTETICWHPYPEGYQVTNEDLWETFQRDYNDWYRFHPNAEQKISENQAYQPITSAYGFTYPSDKDSNGEYVYRDGLVSDFLTDEVSKWKWLGDYITEIANPTSVPESNEALWEEFKTYFNESYYDSNNKYYNKENKYPRASTTTMANAAVFWPSGIDNDDVNIMTDPNSNFKWLGDYIKSVSEAKGIVIDSELKWRGSVRAFFNTSAETLGSFTPADFSEAGKYENWLPYYVSSDGKSPINTEMEWRKEVYAFFNHTNSCGYTDLNGNWKRDNTGDYTTAGLSDQANNGANGWFDEWWNATFKPTMEAYPSDSLPTIRRKGYALGGWYYGNDEGYSLNDREATKGITRGGCLWARWLETCLYEGYITGTVANSAAKEEMGRSINRNFELIETAHNKSDYAIDIERKLQGGVYNTFALPFALSRKTGALNHVGKIVDAETGQTPLLADETTSILRYQGSAIIENGVGEYVLQLNFAEWEDNGEYDYIAASSPFLIKPENDIKQRMRTKWNPFISVAFNNVQDAYVEFLPVLAPTEVQGGAGTNNLILVGDNRLARLTSTGTMLGLRGYFNGSEIPSDLSPKQVVIKITEKNGVVTYLDNIETPQQGASAIKIMQNGMIYILRDGKMYNIMGQEVGR